LSETRSGRPVGVVVMGPSGVGKTTVAELLADRLGWTFAEGDSFHPPANIEKMRRGIPLDDADRGPWLELIRDWIARHAAAGRPTVITCSALKRRYRDVLRGAGNRVRFVQLVGDPALVARRLRSREGHHMPPSLLDSQLAALEPLQDDEDGVVVSVAGEPNEVVSMALTALGLDRADDADG
jgi:gluconokinase